MRKLTYVSWIAAVMVLSGCSLEDSFLFDKEDEGKQGFIIDGVYDYSTPPQHNGIAPNGVQVSTCNTTRLQNFLRRSQRDSIAQSSTQLGSLYLDLGSIQSVCTDSSATRGYIVDLISPDLSNNSKWSSIDKLYFKYLTTNLNSTAGAVGYEVVAEYVNGFVKYVPEPVKRLDQNSNWAEESVALPDDKGQLKSIRFRLFFKVDSVIGTGADNIDSTYGLYIDTIAAHDAN